MMTDRKKMIIKNTILYVGAGLVGLFYPFNVFHPFDLAQLCGLLLSSAVWTFGFELVWENWIWFRESFLNLFRGKQ